MNLTEDIFKDPLASGATENSTYLLELTVAGHPEVSKPFQVEDAVIFEPVRLDAVQYVATVVGAFVGVLFATPVHSAIVVV